MNVFKTSALLIGLAMALWIGSKPVVEVAASPLPGAVQAVPDSTSAIEQVQDRPRVRPRPPRDYPRYPYRTPTYRYYYDGGWYAAPWWLWFGPFSFGFGTPYYAGNWDAHVQWCLNRYRSYDPRSDTFLGYDGLRHRCRSPYRP